MKEDRKNKRNIPNLRFPEFTGEWVRYRFQEIVQMTSGGTPSMQCPEYWEGDIPFISAATMHDTFISSSNQYITEDGLKDGSKLLVKDNLLLLVRGSMLWRKVPICYNKINIAFNQDVKGLITSDKSTSIFMLYWFQSKEPLLKYKVTGTGIGAGKLDSDDILSLSTVLPSKIEQSKISKIFSLLDDRISTQSKIIEGLKELKASLSKQIFSRKLRFKDENANDFPEWVETKLGEIAETYSGGTPTSTNNSYYIGNIPFIKSGEISSDKTEQFINEEALKNSSAKMVSKGNLLLALYGATSGEVAISQIAGAINQAVLVIKSMQNTNFLHHFLRCNKENIISTYLQGGQGNLSAQIVKSITINLPSLTEQKKIADFLSEIDSKIEVETKIFEFQTRQKQYLLKQMFI